MSTDHFFGKIQGISGIHKIRVKTLPYRFIIMEDVTILDQNNFFVGIYFTFREDWLESFPKFFTVSNFGGIKVYIEFFFLPVYSS